MDLLLMAVEAVGLIVGSLTAAVLVCWFLWQAFQLVRHPEWEALAIVTMLGLAFVGALPRSPFLEMTLTFAAVAAVPLWFAGRAWRTQRQFPSIKLAEHPASSTLIARADLNSHATPYRLYPAITACICEDRRPTREEIHVVAARLWREGLEHRFKAGTKPASFAARRVLVRTAIAALRGRSGKVGG
jgi:hypothetical protein